MGKSVFRHQLGSLQVDDQLIYQETNPDIAVSVSNTLSEEFILINIATTFMPKSNEIWVKNSSNLDEKFWLIQPLQVGVNYQIKHSGEFLYKMTNEDDGSNYSIKRIALPSQLKKLGEFESEEVNNEKKQLSIPKDVQRIPGRHELPPVTKHLTDRVGSIVNELEALDEQNKQLQQASNEEMGLVLPKNITDLVEAEYGVKIIQFEAFKSYLAIIQERNKIRELKIVNLIS